MVGKCAMNWRSQLEGRASRACVEGREVLCWDCATAGEMAREYNVRCLFVVDVFDCEDSKGPSGLL